MRSISGMVAERDRHQAGVLRVRARLARTRENAVGRKRADRQVVVAGPAETAEIGAAADHLDEEARPELGVGREDARAGRIDRFGRRQRRPSSPPPARRCLPWARTFRSCRPRCTRRRRTTECRTRASARATSANRAAPPSFSTRARPDAGTSSSPSPAAIDVGEQGQRLGVHEGHGAADDDERIARGAIGRAHRHAGQPQHRQDVRVVPLERHRERDDVEVARRATATRA